MPAQERISQSQWPPETGIESIGKRLGHLAAKVEQLVCGVAPIDSESTRHADDLPDIKGEDSPPNPLRYWRWE